MSFLEKWIEDINEFHQRKINYENQFFLKKILKKNKISDLDFINKINGFFNEDFLLNINNCHDKVIFDKVLQIYNQFSSLLSYDKNYKILNIFLENDLSSPKIKNLLYNFKSAMEVKHQSEININTILSNLK